MGTKEIHGKKARGFQIAMKKMDPEGQDPGVAEIWLDTESNLPVFVRTTGVRGLDDTATEEYTNIQWNVDIDPKLFDTTPPEGYTDETPQPLTLEKQVRQVTEALGIYAEASRGHYPQVDFLGEYPVNELCKMFGMIHLPDLDATQGNAGTVRKAINGFDVVAHLQSYNPGFAYYGKRVGPTDKDKVLLRWRLDDSRYEVIFGDLRSETVTAERLRALEGK